MLRSCLSNAEDRPGEYLITADKAVVGPNKELGNPPFMAELPSGAQVSVVEVVAVAGSKRLRGRIDDPVSGWISLANTATGFRWAERQTDSLDDFDASIEEVRSQLCEETGEACDLTEELTAELRDRLRSDVLYLSVLRRYEAEGLPLLPSFDGPEEKTWAMSGEGMEQWEEMAKSLKHEVALEPIQDRLRNFQRAILSGKEEYGSVLAAYDQVFINRKLGQQLVGYAASFEGFLKRFAETKREVLQSVGGSGGLPSRNRTSTGSGGGGREADQQENMEWLAFFMMLHENTRMSQADAYFGHALFGLCLRRLVQRFELERSLGTLPELPEDVLARLSLERSVSTAKGEAQMAAAQFAAFAQRICESDGGVLARVLSLSKTSIAAIRRQIEYVFGSGLRDEIAKPMDRAADELEKEDTDATPLEATSSFLIEAAASGELRMLSADPPARERLAWDAVLYGALLQGADDATPQP